jgi:hypothetical protein
MIAASTLRAKATTLALSSSGVNARLRIEDPDVGDAELGAGEDDLSAACTTSARWSMRMPPRARSVGRRG